MKQMLIFHFLLLIVCTVSAQTKTTWNRKGCAVVLTYDDALNVDFTNALPVLDSAGLKATFYISDYFHGLNQQIAGWRKAAAEGHELGNHTVYHPCEGGRPGREFVQPDYDLNHYSLRRITDEILTMNTILKAIDGKTKRTFAYPCGDIKIHDTAYFEPVKKEFVAARGVHSEMLPIDKIDLSNIGCYAVNGQTADQLISLVKQAMEKHALLVFLFHGVGGGHSLNVSLQAHSQLIHFLKENQEGVWIAPMIDVAEYIQKYQSSKNNAP